MEPPAPLGYLYYAGKDPTIPWSTMTCSQVTIPLSTRTLRVRGNMTA